MRAYSIGLTTAGFATVGSSMLLACMTLSAMPANLLAESAPDRSVPLPVQEVARKLEERNAQQSATLSQFQGTRIYRMQYSGFPTRREAEMVVRVTYRAPGVKEFTIVSQSGSTYLVDHVLKRLLQDEQECSREPNRSDIVLNAKNYTFSLAGYETTSDGPQYVLNVAPKTPNKYLYRGKVWVDARDFAVTRIDAEPARNPSLWVSKTRIIHQYGKVEDFWLPSQDRTESAVRMGGRAILTIEYRDYNITRARHVASLAESQPRASSK